MELVPVLQAMEEDTCETVKSLRAKKAERRAIRFADEACFQRQGR